MAAGTTGDELANAVTNSMVGLDLVTTVVAVLGLIIVGVIAIAFAAIGGQR